MHIISVISVMSCRLEEAYHLSIPWSVAFSEANTMCSRNLTTKLRQVGRSNCTVFYFFHHMQHIAHDSHDHGRPWHLGKSSVANWASWTICPFGVLTVSTHHCWNWKLRKVEKIPSCCECKLWKKARLFQWHSLSRSGGHSRYSWSVQICWKGFSQNIKYFHSKIVSYIIKGSLEV